MHGIKRLAYQAILNSLEHFPAVAILGPRQCGKTTLAFEISRNIEKSSHYLDLEKSQDLSKLDDPYTYLNTFKDQLVIIDEVQHRPSLFPEIRGLIDEGKRSGLGTARFLFLGSASYELLRQSGESLAGRIIYHELTPFRIDEVQAGDIQKLWNRGGFADSFLASNDDVSMLWRKSFLDTYLNKDLSFLGKINSAVASKHLLQMLAHLHGQILNIAQLNKAHDFSRKDIVHHLDLFEQSYMLRKLPPFFANVGKRLVKRPKVYLRDSGVLHALLAVNDFDQLSGHPIRGVSWEGFIIENIIDSLPNWQPYFYRTSHGAELDLLMYNGSDVLAFEIKVSSSPKVSKGFYNAIEDLKAKHAFVVSNTNETWQSKDGVIHGNFFHLKKHFKNLNINP